MTLSASHQPGDFPQDLLWKQTLLVSLVVHAMGLWLATTWWQKSVQKADLQPQVIEVEVVERAESATAASPAAKLKPVVPPAAVRRSAPSVQPQPMKKVPPPTKRQVQVPQQSQTESQMEPVPAVLLAPHAEQGDQLDQRHEEQRPEPKAIAADESASVNLDSTIDLRRAYQQQLKELIEKHKQYPLMARKGRQQGRVVIEFSINTTGTLVSAQVAQSSGQTLLDRAALKAVRAVAVFPEPPAALSGDSRFQIAISFTLE
jgi:TonB family protein